MTANQTGEAGRKTAEQALRQSEEHYRSLFEANPHPMWVYDRETLRFLAVNDAAVDHYGYSRDEFLAMTIAEIRPIEDVPRLAEHLAHAGAADVGYAGIWRHRVRDGTLIDVEITSHPLAFADRPGELVLAHDVTARKRLEDAARRGQEQLKALVSTVDGIVWEADADTLRFTFVSPRAERLLGHPLSRWTEEPAFWADHIHPDDREQAVRYCVESTREQRAHEFEYRMLAADGRYVWLRDIVTVAVDNGQPAKLRGIMVDITARKIAELRSQRLAQLFAALSQCNQAIVRCSSEADLFPEICRVAVTFGGMAMAWIGVTDEASMVTPVASYGTGTGYLDGIRISVDANDPFGRGPTGTAIRDNRPVWSDDFAHDPSTAQWHERARRYGWAASGSLPLTRNGRPVGALTIYAFTAETFDDDGRELMTEMAADISFALDTFARETARRQAEEALREGEARLKRAQEIAKLGSWTYDLSGRISWSDEMYRIYGVSPESFTPNAESFFDLIHPDDRPAMQEWIRACTAREKPGELEFRAVLPDGSVCFVSGRGKLMCDADGRPTHISGTAQDITGRKRADQALQASLREKEALLKEVHHRVKNNLQVITSLLRLESGRCAHDATKAVLGEMQNRILSMALLHETLYRSGNLAQVDLAAYLTQLATQIFRSQAPSSGGVALRLNLASAPVDMDQAVSCGLLVNELVSNGLKHGFPDGRTGEIRIELQPVDGGPRFRLQIGDTGVGLPADLEQRRARSLGLQLVSDLSRQLSGTLNIGPGPGAIFSLVFVPKASAASANEER